MVLGLYGRFWKERSPFGVLAIDRTLIDQNVKRFKQKAPSGGLSAHLQTHAFRRDFNDGFRPILVTAELSGRPFTRACCVITKATQSGPFRLNFRSLVNAFNASSAAAGAATLRRQHAGDVVAVKDRLHGALSQAENLAASLLRKLG